MRKLKTHIIKLTVIVISVIYLLIPIHKEVKNTIHSVSHFLQMPNVLLSHNHYKNLNSKIEVSAITYHEHIILDLLDSFIEARNNNKDSNKPNLDDNKIDKHFQLSKDKVLKLVTTKSSSVLDNYKEKVKDLFYRKFKVPPKK